MMYPQDGGQIILSFLQRQRMVIFSSVDLNQLFAFFIPFFFCVTNWDMKLKFKIIVIIGSNFLNIEVCEASPC